MTRVKIEKAVNILKGINKDECVMLNNAELNEVLKRFGNNVTVRPLSTNINEIVDEIRSHYPEVADVTDEAIVREISKYAHVIEKPTEVYHVTPEGIVTMVRDDIYDEYYKWRIGYIMFNGKPLFLYVSDYDLLANVTFHVDRPYTHEIPVCTCIVNGDYVYVGTFTDCWVDPIDPGTFKMVHVGNASYVVVDDYEPEYVVINGIEYVKYTLYAK